MGRPRIPKEKKIALLTSIKDKKHILFSKCTSEVEKLTVRNVWNDILLQAKALQLVSPEKNWQYLRDQVYSVWKAKSLVCQMPNNEVVVNLVISILKPVCL